MSLRFGTDGIRADARDALTAPVVAALGRAGAEVLGADGLAVGRDTRESGPSLAAALHAGVGAAGGESVDLGVVPTPAVALWCAREGVAGAVVSASHNPWHDNGIKFFAPGGSKLGDDMQDQIQARFDEILAVGDLRFQEKCLRRLETLRNRGATIVFVSHSSDLVERLTSRAIWLERGRVRFSGDVESVLDVYEQRMSERVGPAAEQPDGALRLGTGEMQITGVHLLGVNGREVGSIQSGSAVTVVLDLNANTVAFQKNSAAVGSPQKIPHDTYHFAFDSCRKCDAVTIVEMS